MPGSVSRAVINQRCARHRVIVYATPGSLLAGKNAARRSTITRGELLRLLRGEGHFIVHISVALFRLTIVSLFAKRQSPLAGSTNAQLCAWSTVSRQRISI